MTLQSLPWVSASVVHDARLAAAMVRGGPTPEERTRAARALAARVRTGQITPKQVTRAVAGGDLGVAQLLSQLACQVPRPRLAPDALALPGAEPHLSRAVREALAELTRTLATDGDLNHRALATISAPGVSLTTVIHTLLKAWANRCARIDAPIRAVLPRGEIRHLRHFGVLPGVLFHLLVIASGRYTGARDADDEEPIPDVVVTAADEMILRAPLPSTDREAQAAQVAVWNAVAGAVFLPLMECASAVLEVRTGYYLEMLRDAALASADANTAAEVSEDVFTALDDQIGIDVSSDEMRQNIFTFFQFLRAEHEGPHWKAQHPACRRWLANPRNARAATAFKRALALAKLARRAPALNDDDYDLSEESDALPPMAYLLPRDIGLEGYFAEILNEEAMQVGISDLLIRRKPSSQVSLGALLDRAITDAAITNAVTGVFNSIPEPASASATARIGEKSFAAAA